MTIHFSLWVGGDGFLGRGGHSNIFELKGGLIPKIEGEGGHTNICTGLKGALRIFEGKLGVMQYFSETIKTSAPPPPLTYKK